MSATTLHTVGRGTARIVGSVVVGMAIMAGLGWWCWSMLIWFGYYGLTGLGIGMWTISDVALPFVVHAKTGGWPVAWLVTFVVTSGWAVAGQPAPRVG